MPIVEKFTTATDLFTATETLNTASEIMPVVRPGDDDYKIGLEGVRGSRVFSALDYGAVGDGSTDDRVAIQRMIDAAATSTRQAVLYFPRGEYNVSSSGSGYGLDLKDKFHIIGDGNAAQNQEGGTQITFTSSTAGDTLFRLTNTQGDNYLGSEVSNIVLRAENGGSVSNLHCFSLGDDGGAHSWAKSQITNVSFIQFSGGCINIVNATSNQEFGSESYFESITANDCGAFLKVDQSKGGGLALGNPLMFDNFHLQGWNDQSPDDYYFDFIDSREIIFNNFTVDGSAPSTTQTAFFYCGGDGWFHMNGGHIEQNAWATNFIEFDNILNGSAGRVCRLDDVRVTVNDLKIAVCDKLRVYISGGGAESGNNTLSTDIIDETNATTGQWQIFWENAGLLEVADRHVGHIVVDSAGDGGSILVKHHTQPIINYEAWRDGWFLGLVSAGHNDRHHFGSNLGYVFLDAGGANHLIGMVDDDEEGRVFAIRQDTTFFQLEGVLNPPSGFEGTADTVHNGAQISIAMRYKFIYNGTSIRALMVNYRGTMGYSSDINVDHTPPPTGWQTGFSTACMDNDTTPGWDMVGSGSPSEAIELRVAWFKVGWGPDVPRSTGGGAYVGSAEAMRPLRWWNDAAPTWGDYKRGDRVDNCLPAVSSPVGWVCTTAGALADAWQATTAYVIGDWVENDSGKIYKCVVAGTSAGSGGPTGIGSGITDNTVTWDYHDAQATFTALANV